MKNYALESARKESEKKSNSLSKVPYVVVSRIAESSNLDKKALTTPHDFAKIWENEIANRPSFEPEKESLYVFLLNTKCDLIAINLVSLGSLNESVAHAREIFRPAVAMGAYGIVLMHNHPSGHPEPSDADRRMTNQVYEAGKILGIRLTDHIIYGAPNVFFSFKSSGLL